MASCGTLTVVEESTGDGGGDDGTDEALPGPFMVTSIAPSTTSVTAGNTLNIEGTISNQGDAEGTANVTLTLDGTTVGSTSVTVSSGGSESVSLSTGTGPLSAGSSYSYAVETGDDSRAGAISINEDTSDGGGSSEPDTSELVVQDMIAASNQPGEVTVEYTVVNQVVSGDGESIAANVDVKVDGNVVETDTIGQVAPGESPQGTTDLTGVGAGEHDICAEVY